MADAELLADQFLAAHAPTNQELRYELGEDRLVRFISGAQVVGTPVIRDWIQDYLIGRVDVTDAPSLVQQVSPIVFERLRARAN